MDQLFPNHKMMTNHNGHKIYYPSSNDASSVSFTRGQGDDISILYFDPSNVRI